MPIGLTCHMREEFAGPRPLVTMVRLSGSPGKREPHETSPPATAPKSSNPHERRQLRRRRECRLLRHQPGLQRTGKLVIVADQAGDMLLGRADVPPQTVDLEQRRVALI